MEEIEDDRCFIVAEIGPDASDIFPLKTRTQWSASKELVVIGMKISRFKDLGWEGKSEKLRDVQRKTQQKNLKKWEKLQKTMFICGFP